jgi:hypothetical protein
MLKLIVIVAVIVAISLLLLGINIFIFGRKFPETEVGKNKNMIKLGIKCPHCEERSRYQRVKPFRIKADELRPDWSMLKT